MIKVLVSTRATQGYRKDDYCWVPDGELLMPTVGGFDLHDEPEGPISFVGIEGYKSTTTFTVAEVDMTPEEYADKVYARVINAWPMFKGDANIKKEIRAQSMTMLKVVAGISIGVPLEMRKGMLSERTAVPPIKYFELVANTPDRINSEISMCGKGYGVPTVEEANQFYAADVKGYFDGQPIFEVNEIDREYAENAYDLDDEASWPLFTKLKL